MSSALLRRIVSVRSPRFPRPGCAKEAFALPKRSQPWFRAFHTEFSRRPIPASSLAFQLNAAPRSKFTVPNARHLSDNSHSAQAPVLPTRAVGRWLLASSALVFSVIVVGGVTRLTESGLSITEWRPVTGIIPPLTQKEWQGEFVKYQATPEFKLLNQNIGLDDFKKIFYMEWAHRVLGRVVGIAFIVPLSYFAWKRQLTRPMAAKLFGMGLLIGFQGVLGWYMVKSGLEASILEEPGAVPRVSHYRLAAHLGTALVLYAGMLGAGLAILKDKKYLDTGRWGGVAWQGVQSGPIARFTRYSRLLTGLVFLTALSGAFVAGLDAGLLYNEFPLMGGRLAPPTDELFSPVYAKKSDKSDRWRNIFENPTTVQFDHRVLAMTTYLSTALLWSQVWRPAFRAALPPLVRASVHAAFALANVQVLLGISTLLYLVPIPLAAAHQAGSVALLSAMVHLLLVLRGPGAVARALRAAKSMQRSPASSGPTSQRVAMLHTMASRNARIHTTSRRTH